MVTNSPDLVFENLDSGVDPFCDLQKEGALFFEIVFIGAVPATIVILAVGVIPGDARQEA